jgi:hypothetical protein
MGQVLNLDDYRPVITEAMRCLFCGTTHTLRHVVGTRTQYFSCPKCDEASSVPEWSLERR